MKQTMIAGLCAKVEHSFRVIERQLGFTKVRYRDMGNNTAPLHALFALSNLLQLARRQLLATAE